jgi:hypothetical protein
MAFFSKEAEAFISLWQGYVTSNAFTRECVSAADLQSMLDRAHSLYHRGHIRYEFVERVKDTVDPELSFLTDLPDSFDKLTADSYYKMRKKNSRDDRFSNKTKCGLMYTIYQDSKAVLLDDAMFTEWEYNFFKTEEALIKYSVLVRFRNGSLHYKPNGLGSNDTTLNMLKPYIIVINARQYY